MLPKKDALAMIEEVSEGLPPPRDFSEISIQGAINGEDYECETSPKQKYFIELERSLTEDERVALAALQDNFFFGFWATRYAIYNAFYELRPYSDFSPSKRQGKEYKMRLRGLKRFWDTHPDDVFVHPSSALPFQDDSVTVPFLEDLFTIDTDYATEIAGTVRSVFEMFPAIGYDYPTHTRNSFAAVGATVSGREIGILMIGDGTASWAVNEGIDGSGLDFVLFHEFAHLVQTANGLAAGNTPESTRYYELMADALGAYYGHHDRGAFFRANRLMDMIEMAYGTGDCGFQVAGHHGTPNQRAKAVEFATDIIDADRMEGGRVLVLPSADFIARFDAAYNDIVAPDI